MFNLYQKSYIRWKIECEEVELTREAIYTKVKNVQKVWWWQSTFNLIWLYNMLIAGFIFGFVSWIVQLYTLIMQPETKNICLRVWGKMTNTIVISVSFIKIFFVYIWVSFTDRYEYSIRIMQLNKCSDDITNKIFENTATSLMSSRYDNIVVLKVTMLMLAFEIINYLTPIIVDLRKSQSHKIMTTKDE
jgi:hypothetical protein